MYFYSQTHVKLTNIDEGRNPKIEYKQKQVTLNTYQVDKIAISS